MQIKQLINKSQARILNIKLLKYIIIHNVAYKYKT